MQRWFFAADQIKNMATCDKNLHRSLFKNTENDTRTLKVCTSPTMQLSAFNSSNEGHYEKQLLL